MTQQPHDAKPRRSSGKRWTAREDKILLLSWHDVSWRKLREYLPGRSATAIRFRAYRTLGLPLGYPQGTVPLGPLARKHHYGPPWARKILEWAGVELRRFNVKANARRPTWLVDELEALEAFRRWEAEAEHAWQAAERLHVREETLVDLMIAAGKRPPRAPGRKRPPRWKNLPAEYDAVVAEHRRRCALPTSGTALAPLLGVSVPTMCLALKEYQAAGLDTAVPDTEEQALARGRAALAHHRVLVAPRIVARNLKAAATRERSYRTRLAGLAGPLPSAPTTAS